MVRKQTAVSGPQSITEDGRNSVRGWNEMDGIRENNFRETSEGLGGSRAKIGENGWGCCGPRVLSVKSSLYIYVVHVRRRMIERIRIPIRSLPNIVWFYYRHQVFNPNLNVRRKKSRFCRLRSGLIHVTSSVSTFCDHSAFMKPYFRR